MKSVVLIQEGSLAEAKKSMFEAAGVFGVFSFESFEGAKRLQDVQDLPD